MLIDNLDPKTKKPLKEKKELTFEEGDAEIVQKFHDQQEMRVTSLEERIN